MINVGLIGICGYAQEYLMYFLPMAEKGLIRLSAAVVINQEEVPEEVQRLQQLGIRIYRTAEEMFAAEHALDLVAIPTGISSHYALSRMAIEHGCNVQVEKPLCGCVQEGLAFLELEKQARQAGLFIAVGFQHGYAPEFHLAKEFLLNGRLGSPRRISVMGFWPRNDQYYTRNAWVGKIRDSAGAPVYDSPASNAFAHYMNISLFLAGKNQEETALPKSVSAAMYRARPEIETFDSCAITLKTEEEAEIRLFLSHACVENRNPHIIVEAERGTFDWQVDGPWQIYGKDAFYNGEVNGILASGIAVKPHAGMFRNVFARIHDPKRFIYTPTMAFPHTCCIEAMHRETPIRILSPEFITRREDRKLYAVQDIEHYFTDAFLGENLFDICPWAGKEPAFSEVRATGMP